MTGAILSPPRRSPFRRIGRWLLLLVGFLVAAHLSMCAALYWVMCQTPDFFGRVMERIPNPIMAVLPFETLWMRARQGALKPGVMAPDFNLPTLDRTAMVRLSSFRGSRPVVLVFGSYT
jgi:hypothetical protein